jgi:ketosteroid isomerase-like protein
MAPLASYKGHDGVRRWFKELAMDNSGYQLGDLDFHEDATTVTVIGTQSTTFTSTGKAESGPFVHIFKFRNGKVYWYGNYVDPIPMFKAGFGGGMPGVAGLDTAYRAPGSAMPSTNMAMGSGMEQQNIAAVQAGYNAFASGDMEALMRDFDDNITWDAVGPAGVLPIFGHWQGKDQVMQWFMQLGSMTTCEPFRNVRYVASGETVVATGESKVTFNNTGKTVDGPFVHIFTFRNGKIVAWQGFEDTAADVMAAK